MSKTFDLKCISCLSSTLSREEYKNICCGLISALKISPETMAAATMLQTVNNPKLISFTAKELRLSEQAPDCSAISEKYKIKYVCRSCRHSLTYSNQNENRERIILSFCLCRKNTSYVDEKLKQLNVFPDDIFQSIYISDPSEVSGYIPLNEYIYESISKIIIPIDENLMLKHIADDVRCHFKIKAQAMKAVNKYLKSLFSDKNHTSSDIDLVLNKIISFVNLSTKNDTVLKKCTETENMEIPSFNDHANKHNLNKETVFFPVDDKEKTPKKAPSVVTENDSTEFFETVTGDSNFISPNTDASTNSTFQNDKFSSNTPDTEPENKENLHNKKFYDKEECNADYSKDVKEDAAQEAVIDKNCLNEYGFLKNDVSKSISDIIPMKNNFDEIRYDFLQAEKLAIEHIVFNGQKGILFYLYECKQYYFCDLKNSNKDMVNLVKNILSDTQHHKKITFFDIPLLSYLYENGLNINNYNSIIELYSVVCPGMYTSPDKLISELMGTDLDIPFPFIVSVMKYYNILCKKLLSYIENQDADIYKCLHIKLYKNQCIAHSLYVKDILAYQKCYLNNVKNKIYFNYHEIANNIPSNYEILSLVYCNDTKTEQLNAVFDCICAKLVTTKLQYSCKVKILNITGREIIFLIPHKDSKTFLSALNHLAIKLGKIYIDPVPQIVISSNRTFD